ncbi:MAG: hypothetical protein ACI3Z7_02545 [Candidatus Aphodosoma sp.]
MNNKLQELTDKLYAEGVEKGKTEAADIVAKAKAEAADIVAKAKAEAEQITADANAKAAETDKNTRAELRLYTAQALNALKTEITDMLSDRIASDSVKAATADASFMQGIIARIAESWIKDGAINIEAKDATALEEYFKANAKELLSAGVIINEVKGIKTDFAISPASGSYKITFGNDEFVAYFKEFLRPKLIEMLF